MTTQAQPLTGTQPAQQILMIAPTGEAAYVPQDQVANYESKGGKVGVRMTAPNGGEKAIVPFDQQDSYQKQGATWDVHPDNDAAKAFLTQRQQAPAEAEQDETKRLVESGESPGAALMKPGQTASAVSGMLAVGSGVGAVSGIMGLAAPSVITEEVATGLLDEFGEPITRQIVKEGPSILGKTFQAATKWIQAHPTTAKAVIETAGVGVGLKLLGKMAKLAQEFGGK